MDNGLFEADLKYKVQVLEKEVEMLKLKLNNLKEVLEVKDRYMKQLIRENYNYKHSKEL